MDTKLPAWLVSHIDVWQSPQTKLPQVTRWSKYIKDEQGAREQNSLQHSHSITILGALVAPQMRSYGAQINLGLLLSALALHDVGEGELGADTLYIDKHVQGDVAEYEAFLAWCQPLGQRELLTLERAFLLQFALKNPPEFNAHARKVMSLLAEEEPETAHAFNAIERYDYVLYAFEQYRTRGNEKILVQTLRHQMPHLDRLAGTVPGVREVIWDHDLRKWVGEFLAVHANKWVEQKGEQ